MRQLFTAKSDGEKNFKISQHLVKLQVKIKCLFRLTVLNGCFCAAQKELGPFIFFIIMSVCAVCIEYKLVTSTYKYL